MLTPVSEKSFTLRVTSVRSCSSAVAEGERCQPELGKKGVSLDVEKRGQPELGDFFQPTGAGPKTWWNSLQEYGACEARK